MWIEHVEESEATGIVQSVYRDSSRRGGTLDNILKVHSLNPNALRALMWRRVGIQRDGAGLESAITRLHDWNHLLARRVFGDEKGWVLANKALAGWLIAHAASVRKESRGTHYRLDYTDTDDVNWLKDVSLVRPDLLGRHARPPTVTPTGPAA